MIQVPFKIYYGHQLPIMGPPVGHGTWATLPNNDIICIAWNDPKKGRVTIELFDYYGYTDVIGWHGMRTVNDIITHIGFNGLGAGGMRFIGSGFWIPDEKYHEIMERAKNDPL